MHFRPALNRRLSHPDILNLFPNMVTFTDTGFWLWTYFWGTQFIPLHWIYLSLYFFKRFSEKTWWIIIEKCAKSSFWVKKSVGYWEKENWKKKKKKITPTCHSIKEKFFISFRKMTSLIIILKITCQITFSKGIGMFFLYPKRKLMRAVLYSHRERISFIEILKNLVFWYCQIKDSTKMSRKYVFCAHTVTHDELFVLFCFLLLSLNHLLCWDLGLWTIVILTLVWFAIGSGFKS